MPLTEEKPIEEKQFLDVEGIAKVLGYHPETVRELLRKGILPGRKAGKEWRSSRALLEEWLREQGQQKPEEQK